MHYAPERASCGAFTLIEVLIALLFAGIAVIVLLGANVASVRLSDDAAHRIRATLLAQSKMAELIARNKLDLGSASGSFEEDDAFRWSADVAEESVPDLPQEKNVKLRRIEVNVTWGDEESGHGVTLVTLVAAREPDAQGTR